MTKFAILINFIREKPINHLYQEAILSQLRFMSASLLKLHTKCRGLVSTLE
jgi:hypothetical protein